ncbi:MAG TPA: hypothetical protein VIG34_03200 [Xanthobacteraceae bacterium]|jgi:hypothetical protein
MVTKDEARVTEAKSALDRLKAEGGGFDSAMPASGPQPGHDPKGSEPTEDGIERWGRIIGRTLGWGAALFLAWQLLRTYGG